MSDNRDDFLKALATVYGKRESVTRQEVIDLVAKRKLKWPAWFVNDPARRIGRGVYSLTVAAVPTVAPQTGQVAESVPVAQLPADNAQSLAAMQGVITAEEKVSIVPTRARGYVPFGNYNDVRTILSSKKFYPAFVTGLSGNGKTMMIEQVCAELGRELIRANITIETDEDDLLGGFRLIDGRTVWQNGPVIAAMERGAVLLLDEVDLGSNKMMCLQPVLEGKTIYLKKINRLVAPAPGFTVVATANTKGKGSDDGRFIGTNVLNEAFLERFSVTMEQEYPSQKVEAKILNNILKLNGKDDKEFVEKLVMWGSITRKTFYEGNLNELISTRRLVHVVEAFIIFGDRQKAIQLCLNRFDADTKKAFMDLYGNLDESVDPNKEKDAEQVKVSDDDFPF